MRRSKIFGSCLNISMLLLSLGSSGQNMAKQLYDKAYDNLEQRNYAEGIKNCTAALVLKPDYKEAIWLRGAIYDKQEQYNDAIKDYTKAIDLYKDEKNDLSAIYANR